jgi:hypothetical protein
MAMCGHTNPQVRRSFGQTSVQPAQIIFGVLDEIQRARCQIVPKSSTQNPPLAPKRDDLLYYDAGTRRSHRRQYRARQKELKAESP